MPKRPPDRPLDRIDRLILRTLQQEGRLPNVELARRVHLTPTPCLERVRRLEDAGYIRGYRACLDPELLGLGLTVFIEVRLDQNGLDVFKRFQDLVVDMPEVIECHMVAGGFDFLLKVRVADMAGYRQFLAERLPLLPGVVQTHTHVVMDEVKAGDTCPV